MEKRNKILIGILTVFLIVGIGVIAKVSLFDKEVKTEVIQTSSVITNIDGTKIILSNKKKFDLKETKKSQTEYNEGDHVIVEYDKNKENKQYIPAISIALSISKEPVTPEVKNAMDKKISEIMNSMSLNEKVAQMFMVRCPSSDAVAQVQQYQMGGYILFDANVLPYTNEQFIANNNAYQSASKFGMLIGIDEEGGTVNRLSSYENYRSTPFQSPQELYKEGGFDCIREDAIEKSQMLKRYGININFAPVADLSTNPNDFIYDRSFGKDAQQTSVYVKTVVEAMRIENIGSVLKHFPGYGNNSDTHTGSAYDERSYENFVGNDFIPFEEAIESGANCVLINHNVITSIEPNIPSSLSEKVHDILRKDLKFEGVIFTDDLIMQAITNTYGDDRSAILAIQAGNDMLLSSDHIVQIPSVINAVYNQEISEERINESVYRILKLKYLLNILK